MENAQRKVETIFPEEIYTKIHSSSSLSPPRFWNIPWQELEVALGIKSSFSLRNLNITDHERAEKFLKHCGFDTHDSLQRKQFEQFFGEALFFIRHVLMTPEERDNIFVPSSLLNLAKPENLIIFTSSQHPRRRYLRMWSCAILKVMYVMANLQYSGRLNTLADAREKIFGRIRSILHTHTDKIHEEHTSIRFEGLSIPLEKVDWKEAKTKTSIILKLLHKTDSIVDEVFDYLGVRFVVEKSCQIPLLLKLLIDADIIIPHQVVSFRTRNSTLSVKRPQKILSFLQELNATGTLTDHEFSTMCENIPWMPTPGDDPKKAHNSFSSEHYRSLQFTVRHLVRTSNPSFAVLESVINQLYRYTGIHRQEPWLESIIPADIAHYFPVEIHLMDKESYELAKFGPASHEQYKARQLKAVREKVLGNLLSFSPEKLRSQEV